MIGGHNSTRDACLPAAAKVECILRRDAIQRTYPIGWPEIEKNMNFIWKRKGPEYP